MSKYYSENAKEYIQNTKNIDMKECYNIFLGYLSLDSKILDVGFGSGRDSLYFYNVGYDVVSIDPVKEFCDNAMDIGLKNVREISIENIDYIEVFDGIWASASLLHLKFDKLSEIFNKCYDALKGGGIMYASFKYGTFEGIIDDRYFTYLTEERLTNIINQTNFKIDKLWISEDKLNRNIKWLNAILKKR